jgi:thymidylate synthase
MLDELTWEEACRMEKWWIAFYGRSDLQKGTLCNLTDGGEGNVNPCDEVRKKLSESKTGKKNPQYGKEHSEEWKTKQSAKLSGVGNPNYGKTLPDWQKEINRKAQLGRKHSIEHIENRITHLRKKVVNTFTGTKYASVKEAAQLNKIAYRTMSRWATNNTNSFKLL